jgi:hypothetical protein
VLLSDLKNIPCSSRYCKKCASRVKKAIIFKKIIKKEKNPIKIGRRWLTMVVGGSG